MAKPLAPDLGMAPDLAPDLGMALGMGLDLAMGADKEEERAGDSNCCQHSKVLLQALRNTRPR